MAKMFDHLKMDQPKMSDAKDIRDTQILDGEAKDSPVMNETNATKQHVTDAQPKGTLGGRNDPNG